MDLYLFAIFMTACGAAASTGAMFQPDEWYEQINRPSWTPPNWLFPIAWTILYIAIAYAASRIAGAEGLSASDVGAALGLWAMQIAFNTLWSPIFFGLKRLGSAMVVIGFLWLSVAGTMIAFWSIDAVAGWIFVPYLIWCSYAGALNFWIWRNN